MMWSMVYDSWSYRKQDSFAWSPCLRGPFSIFLTSTLCTFLSNRGTVKFKNNVTLPFLFMLCQVRLPILHLCKHACASRQCRSVKENSQSHGSNFLPLCKQTSLSDTARTPWFSHLRFRHMLTLHPSHKTQHVNVWRAAISCSFLLCIIACMHVNLIIPSWKQIEDNPGQQTNRERKHDFHPVLHCMHPPNFKFFPFPIPTQAQSLHRPKSKQNHPIPNEFNGRL